ncbi:MAG: amino acid ABC transporter permease [Alphaproteobacteria bacterium]|nr:amino acid ABC transporter permease [Alphaproteobacteria bacterium]
MALSAASAAQALDQGGRPPPVLERGVLRWLRTNLFASWWHAGLTLLGLYVLVAVLPPFWTWAVAGASFAPGQAGAEACARAAGACWSVIAEKHRVMLFGLYPYEQHWRPLVAMLLWCALVLASCVPSMWRPSVLAPLWLAGGAACLALMGGGVAGLAPVANSDWGGLPLTILLFTGTVLIGLPLAALMALGRRSELPAISGIMTALIELTRGVPLVTVLFVAAVLFPLFMPAGVNFDKLLRAQIGMAIFFACYEAEVIRGGLQAIPRGQIEAATSLGLGYWRRTVLIVLPQALRIAIPGIMNHIIAAFKNTSLVIIIGLLDFLNATKASLVDPPWQRYATEAYLFLAVVYFLVCWAMSQYSQWLERRLADGRPAG